MAVSEVSICNSALIKLGEDTIVALSDDTNRARVMNSRYEFVRDAELRRNKWRFAIKRASLAALSTAPDSDFDLAYQLPTDYIRLVEGGDLRSRADLSDYRSTSSQLYSVENGMILTNIEAPLAIRYMAKITDPAVFDATFVEALSARLAFECCERITQSDSKKQICWQDYRNSIKEAIAASAIENPAESIADDTWVMARLL
jgi:hypothetical protein